MAILTPRESMAILTPRESMVILILLICESIGLLSQLFLGKNRLNNDVHKENGSSLQCKILPGQSCKVGILVLVQVPPQQRISIAFQLLF